VQTCALPILHLIAKAPELGDAIGRFKSYTTRQIIDLLERRHTRTLLHQFERLKLRHKKDSKHQFWQEGSEPKQIRSDETMWQKLEYIHMNPVKRGYVDDPVHWRYSSARNYAKLPSLIDVVTDWK